jgi:GMP synthase PP-ATPase subunit
MTTHTTPPPVPASRILGDQDRTRRSMLACVDVVVGYVTALRRFELDGWTIQPALVESRAGFRGGETVALRCTPAAGRTLADVAPVPVDVLRELATRIVGAIDGIAHVVPDIASSAPDVAGDSIDFGFDGVHVIGLDLDGFADDLRSA